MIISHSHKFIFIHISKCGGTSITNALLPYLGENDLVLGSSKRQASSPLRRRIEKGTSIIRFLFPYLERKFLKRDNTVKDLEGFAKRLKNTHSRNGYQIDKHSSATEIRGFIGSPEVWDNYFKFAFVRNPWDRIVSTYFWFQKTGWKDSRGNADKVRSLPDFSSYAKSEYLYFVKSCTSMVLESDQLLVDYVGKCENLEQDFSYVCRRIGLPEIELPKLNVAHRSRDYRRYYDEEAKQIIFDKYRDDIEKFGYHFLID